MIVKGWLRKGEYFDSVSLMIVSRDLNQLPGVIDSSVVMGTTENKAILTIAGLLLPEFAQSTDTDLLIVIKSENEAEAINAWQKVDTLLKAIRSKTDKSSGGVAHSINSAVKMMPGANLVLISIAGKYAAAQTKKALQSGLHVMLFSDNVSLQDEIELKKMASQKGLLLMGPDCGTAILNGIPLAFANRVNQGNIGIVGASGTGIQEVSSLISNMGGGISQAIGTGGRDVKKEVGGTMFIDAFRALNSDPATAVIVLISKPPHPDVLLKVKEEVKNCKKPVVGIFIGSDGKGLENSGIHLVSNLEDAAKKAVELSDNHNDIFLKSLEKAHLEIPALANIMAKESNGKYLRGLFSGGTLCDEAQLVLKNYTKNIYSNTPLAGLSVLENEWKSKANTIVDLGDDKFTSGRPHPMIDFSLRNKRIVEEASDPETAVILLDVVLGYGSHPDPASELVPAIRKAKSVSQKILFVCSITGTDKDPQDREKVKSILEKEGVVVMPGNYAACRLCGEIINNIELKN